MAWLTFQFRCKGELSFVSSVALVFVFLHTFAVVFRETLTCHRPSNILPEAVRKGMSPSSPFSLVPGGGYHRCVPLHAGFPLYSFSPHIYSMDAVTCRPLSNPLLGVVPKSLWPSPPPSLVAGGDYHRYVCRASLCFYSLSPGNLLYSRGTGTCCLPFESLLEAALKGPCRSPLVATGNYCRYVCCASLCCCAHIHFVCSVSDFSLSAGIDYVSYIFLTCHSPSLHTSQVSTSVTAALLWCLPGSIMDSHRCVCSQLLSSCILHMSIAHAGCQSLCLSYMSTVSAAVAGIQNVSMSCLGFACQISQMLHLSNKFNVCGMWAAQHLGGVVSVVHSEACHIFRVARHDFWSCLFKIVHNILYTLAEQGIYALYNWSIQLYTIPRQNIAVMCRTLSFTLQRNLMSSHDFCALLAHSHLPPSVSTFCKSQKAKLPLHASSLISFHIAGTPLPLCLNLNWLFITYDILTFCGQMSDLAGCKHLISLPRSNYKQSEVCCRYFTATNTQPEMPDNKVGITAPVGGGRPHVFLSEAILPYLINQDNNVDSSTKFLFIDHVDNAGLASLSTEQYVCTNVPLPNIIPHIPIYMIQKIAQLHHIAIGSHVPKKNMLAYFANHNCTDCNQYFSVFSVAVSPKTKRNLRKRLQREAGKDKDQTLRFGPG